MGDTSKPYVTRKKHVCVGILAHVDAGKTTLSEALLYAGGSIRKMGRVDNGDAFLDTYALERARGITIFSKQAVLPLGDMELTLLDTPGHVDFSAEMERTLQVLDYGILVISGADGVQGHTRTLWHLLKKYGIPVFLFMNKMDQEGTDRQTLLTELKARLDDGCVDFFDDQSEEFFDQAAMCDEGALEEFLEEGRVGLETIRSMIQRRKLFPCFFGSALKSQGVQELMTGLERYIRPPAYPEVFGARVFKIARDEQGNRLTYMKITGGSLKARTILGEEKVNQIRIYSGEKYQVCNEVEAGQVCAVTGLLQTKPGQGLGEEKLTILPSLEPVLSYQVILPEGMDASVMLPKLRQIEEEEPELHILWDEDLKEIQAHMMGEVQTEILKSLIAERFGVDVEFGMGNIVYKETITNTVEGVGHFEPLRHYAEVHLLLEPGEAGSGLVFAADCSEDLLSRNWQRLVLTHLEEKEHKGVLIGAAITDMKITLVSGRAHQKHTEGGDFRQATYRAVRQGLKEAKSVLLEPYYEFRLEIPEEMIGRAMTDIEKMSGTFELPHREQDMAVLTGTAPVAAMRDYQKEVIAYSKGHGKLFCSLSGYRPCHNTEDVVERVGYDSERDVDNPAGSVFCAHGAGFVVPWHQVKDYMHLEAVHSEEKSGEEADVQVKEAGSSGETWIGTEEIDAILARTFYANSRHKSMPERRIPSAGGQRRKANASAPAPVRTFKKQEPKDEYLLVDGYNVIYGWEELKELAETTIDGARGRLLDILCNYQGIRRCHLIVVFDAYRVQGHTTECLDYHNIHVVYTKEAETADQYIERFAHDHGKQYDVTVATSDGLEQIIIRGQGCRLLSARDLQQEIKQAEKTVMEAYGEKPKGGKHYLFDALSEETAEKLREIQDGREEEPS